MDIHQYINASSFQNITRCMKYVKCLLQTIILFSFCQSCTTAKLSKTDRYPLEVSLAYMPNRSKHERKCYEDNIREGIENSEGAMKAQKSRKLIDWVKTMYVYGVPRKRISMKR
jgi:hypothetical protein